MNATTPTTVAEAKTAGFVRIGGFGFGNTNAGSMLVPPRKSSRREGCVRHH